jgi:hypothetical protein
MSPYAIAAPPEGIGTGVSAHSALEFGSSGVSERIKIIQGHLDRKGIRPGGWLGESSCRERASRHLLGQDSPSVPILLRLSRKT